MQILSSASQHFSKWNLLIFTLRYVVVDNASYIFGLGKESKIILDRHILSCFPLKSASMSKNFSWKSSYLAPKTKNHYVVFKNVKIPKWQLLRKNRLLSFNKLKMGLGQIFDLENILWHLFLIGERGGHYISGVFIFYFWCQHDILLTI